MTSYNHDWFAGCKSTADVKSTFRRLAMEHHPDRGGDNETMKSINAAYHTALRRFDGMAEAGSDGQDHTYRYNSAQETEVVNKLFDLLRANLPGCEIWLIGKWLWVTGDTKPVKETLKQNGCFWHSKRTCWYWKPKDSWSRYNSKADLADLASFYGARMFAGKDNDSAMAAA